MCFFHNDDVTPIEAVVTILVSAFDKSIEDAFIITHMIHNSDKGVVGVYELDEAYERVEKAEGILKEIEGVIKHEIPLLMTVERH